MNDLTMKFNYNKLTNMSNQTNKLSNKIKVLEIFGETISSNFSELLRDLPSMHKICRHLPHKHVQLEPAGFFGIHPIATKPKQ